MKKKLKKFMAITLATSLLLSNTVSNTTFATATDTDNQTVTETTEEPIATYEDSITFDENGNVIDDSTKESTDSTTSESTESSTTETSTSSEDTTEVSTESTEETTSSEESTSTEISTEENTTEDTEKSTEERCLYVKINDGGTAKITFKNGDEKTVCNLEYDSEKDTVVSDNKDITVEKVKDNFYKILTFTEDTEIEVEVTSKENYKINTYAKKIDTGKWETVNESVTTDTHKFNLEKDLYLNISFIEDIENETLETHKIGDTNYYFTQGVWDTSFSALGKDGKSKNMKNWLKNSLNLDYTGTNYSKNIRSAAKELSEKDGNGKKTVNWTGITGTLKSGSLSKGTAIIDIDSKSDNFADWTFKSIKCCSPTAADVNETDTKNKKFYIDATATVEKSGNNYSVTWKMYFCSKGGTTGGSNNLGLTGYQNARIKKTVSTTNTPDDNSIKLTAQKVLTQYYPDANLDNITITATVSTTIDNTTYSQIIPFDCDSYGIGRYNGQEEVELTTIGGSRALTKDDTVNVTWVESGAPPCMTLTVNNPYFVNTYSASLKPRNDDADDVEVSECNIELYNDVNYGSTSITKVFKDTGSSSGIDQLSTAGIRYGLFAKENIIDPTDTTLQRIAVYNGKTLTAGTLVAAVDISTANRIITNLPYGNYYFQELRSDYVNESNQGSSTWANDYYLWDGTKLDVTINSTTRVDKTTEKVDPTPRGNISFSKWYDLAGKYQSPLPDTPFLITWSCNGRSESHVVLTDENGKFNSSGAVAYDSLRGKGLSASNYITNADIANAKASGGTALCFGTVGGLPANGNLAAGVFPVTNAPGTISVMELWSEETLSMKNMKVANVSIGGTNSNLYYVNDSTKNLSFTIPGDDWSDIQNVNEGANGSFRNDYELAHVSSLALSDATKTHMLPISDVTTGDDLGDGITRITDTLSCTKLAANHNYLLKAKLVEVPDNYENAKVNFDDVEAFVDSSGNKLECNINFNSSVGTTSDDGISYTVPMNYIMNSTDVAGKTFVALVQLYDQTLAQKFNVDESEFITAQEINLDNKNQSLYSGYPETDAYDINSNGAMIYAEEVEDASSVDESKTNGGILITDENEDFKNIKFSIEDKITLHNFDLSNTYYVVSELREYTTDTLISNIGTEDAPIEKEIKSEDGNDYIYVPHTNVIIPKVDTRQGLRLYVTEKIYVKNNNGEFIKVAQHVDKEDPRQTVYFTGLDSIFDSVSHQSAVTKEGETTTLTDNLILRNLVLGQTYKLVNFMRDNTPKEEESANIDSKPNKETTTDNKTQTDSSKDNTLESETLEVDENTNNNSSSTTNNDTTSKDESTESNETTDADLEKCIKDFDNIVIINGKKVAQIKYITVDEEMQKKSLTTEGYIVPFTYTLDTSSLAGMSVTFGEQLFIDNQQINYHHRLNDKNEQTRFPIVKTTAKDTKTLTQMAASGETELVDTVKLTNLQAGRKQTVKGILMDKATGDYLGKDLGLDPITGEYEWTTKEDDSERDIEVQVKFSIPNSLIYAGKQTVVFEELYTEGELTGFHRDINDEGQTITFVEEKTTAFGDEDSKFVYPDEEIHTIKDVVHYKGLEVGKTYTQTGSLWKDDSKGNAIPFLVDGVQPIASVEFTPTTSEGDITIEFQIPTKALSGETFVIFEDCYYNGVKVATHADLTDDNQTLFIPKTFEISIAKADKDKVKYFLKGAEITIYDKDGNVALDTEGNECVGTTDKDGLVQFSIYCKDGESFYAKETKAPNGYYLSDETYEVTPTDKLDELNRNIIKINILDEMIVIPPKNPKTSDTLPIAGLVFLLATGFTGIIVFRKRKKNVQ